MRVRDVMQANLMTAAPETTLPYALYKVMPQALTNHFLYLFDKPWVVPTCAQPWRPRPRTLGRW
jgi:hypothetical protein